MSRSNIFGKVALGLFTGAVLVLTVLSKSIYNDQLPVVSVSSPEKGIIENVEYDALIPVAALRTDATGYYVLVVHKEDSVLGKGYFANRISVDLLGSDQIYCAVRGLPTDEIVIVSATGEIADRSKVYYEGGDPE